MFQVHAAWRFIGRAWIVCLAVFLLGLSVQMSNPSARDEVRISAVFQDEQEPDPDPEPDPKPKAMPWLDLMLD